MMNKWLASLFFFFISLQLLAQDTIREVLEQNSKFVLDEEKLDTGGVAVFHGFYFELGSACLIDSSSYGKHDEFKEEKIYSNKMWLGILADYLWRHPTYIVEIRVHMDCRGSDRRSVIYSQKRAEYICKKLVGLGVEEERLIPRGFESTKPYNDNGILLTCDYIKRLPPEDADLLHQKNRRQELVILSKDYQPE